MIDLGLGSVGMHRLIETRSQPHFMRVLISLMDLNNNYLQTLTTKFYDGQINISANNEVTRSGSLVLYDPSREVNIDTFNPNEGALYYNRMVSIVKQVWRFGDTPEQRVDIPVFRGPITDAERDGNFLNITLMGKEVLAQGVIWNPRTYAKGYNKGDMVLDILKYGAGETRFELTPTTAKLGEAVSLIREAITWTEANNVATGMGMHMFYDGRGTLRMRPYPTTVSFVFRNGQGGSIVTTPKWKFKDDVLKNVVRFKGGAPKVGAAAIDVYAYAPTDHPANHNNLGRLLDNGQLVPRRLLETLEDDTVKSIVEAAKRAQQSVDEFLLQGTDVAFDCAPNDLLEEGDLAAVAMEGQYVLPFRMRDMSIPLRGGDVVASVGATKNLSLKVRA